jgi:hypothetical protein
MALMRRTEGHLVMSGPIKAAANSLGARVVFGLLMLCAALPAKAADDLPVAAFFGTFQGSGIAVSQDAIYAPETARDMDVTIQQAGDGFTIQWTTVSRSGVGDIKRKSESLTFRLDAKGSRYVTDQRADPLSSDGLAWANIEKQTLNVFLLMIDAKGRYSLQRYARTLSSQGMELLFVRTHQGSDRRIVKGLLVKVAN